MRLFKILLCDPDIEGCFEELIAGYMDETGSDLYIFLNFGADPIDGLSLEIRDSAD